VKTIQQMLAYLRDKSLFGISEADERFLLAFDQNADVSVLFDALRLTQFTFIYHFARVCYTGTEKARTSYILLRECKESGVFATAHNEYKSIVKAAEKRYIDDPKMTEAEFHASYMSQYAMRDEKYAAEWTAFKLILRQPLLDWLEELL
jgi:hypothetical protein